MKTANGVARGECIAYPGPWAFTLPHAGIILVSDAELVRLADDPDAVLDLSTGFNPRKQSLRQVCEAARAAGAVTLMIAFDHFFAQYRPGIDHARELTPDMPEYIERMARIGTFAKAYGLKLELSLLSPLEIGRAYVRQTGESGRWMQFRKGLRDPKTGAFSVQYWQHRRWVNNKGPVDVVPDGIRVFAFRETPVPGTSQRCVLESDIVELHAETRQERFDGIEAGGVARRVRVSGAGSEDIGPLDRVLVVQRYRVDEMDYFSPSALPYLTGLVDAYLDAGVELSGFYSDEMHIQQDWSYFSHHEHGQFPMRYVSPGLERRFAEAYGEQYADLAPYLVYFTCGQEDFAPDMSATEVVGHAFGPSPEDIARTALFRSRYYELLQNGVVDLFLAARRHSEERVGHILYTRAHATWAESPTIDYWRPGPAPMNSIKYEYDSRFVWSNTVHQAASACHDYFKWGEYLTGTGNDHAECGWLDRNYTGLALACSTGIINEIPYSYGAHWGSPAEVARRRHRLELAFGVGHPDTPWSRVQDTQHRDVDVLMLYPLDLVAAEERFGSWMTQYAYANQITAAKLLECGTVRDGALHLAGRRFTTLVACFEPLPQAGLLDLLSRLAEAGGRVIWSGPPPVLDREGNPIRERWEALFGVRVDTGPDGFGLPAPGRRIGFEGPLAPVPEQTILTDMLPDRIYPVTDTGTTRVAARSGARILGTERRTESGGLLAYLGFRPRDDQSGSMGYDSRTWFDCLAAWGAYPPANPFAARNDNTEFISRNGPYLICRFPNGSLAVAPHLKDVEECWEGGFSRKPEEDAKVLERLELPSEMLDLADLDVNGRRLSYRGRGTLAFRADDRGRILAFAGDLCSEITVNGRRTVFAGSPMETVGWAPVPAARRIPGGAELVVQAGTPGVLRIPKAAHPGPLEFFTEGSTPGAKGTAVPCVSAGETHELTITPESVGRRIFGIPTQPEGVLRS